MNLLHDDEMPIGLGMALAENMSAMQSFANMSRSQKIDVMRHARGVESRDEMHALVSELAR